MHGIIFSELKKFVATRHGEAAWKQVLEGASLVNRTYLVTSQYPDEEVVRLVQSAVDLTHAPPARLLEEFGEFLVPDLLQLYGSLVRPEWKTLELLEHTEAVIHAAVRMRQPGAEPPRLIVERRDPKEVRILYSSSRKLCSVAKGIVQGVAKHYGQTVVVREPECMHKGARRCDISVRLVSS